ncbi:helix-turn-helix domain-containing protein [Cytobacillus firmus]|uniref:helix-turn-helix domain-containing protein n=1 Tax=Cytobacillus firmus TaxID=1399 RepID=UPI003BA08D9F
MSTGDRIKEFRKKNNLTQTQLAKKVNVSSQVVSNWERGYTSPGPDDIVKLSKTLDVSADYLLGNTDEPSLHQNEITKYNDRYDSLSEINELIEKYGIEDMGFFDIEAWKNLSPLDVKLIEEHFKSVVKIAKERNEEKINKK